MPKDNDAILVARDAALEGKIMIATKLLVEAGFDLESAKYILSHDGQPKEGDILVSHWGYDQTNITFFLVTKVTAKSVRITKLRNRYVGQEDYNNLVMPAQIDNVGYREDNITRRFTKGAYNVGYRVNISSYSSAVLWNGEPQRETRPEFGH